MTGFSFFECTKEEFEQHGLYVYCYSTSVREGKTACRHADVLSVV